MIDEELTEDEEAMGGVTGQPLELPAHQARTQVALPPEGVPVYCAKGDACQHALWTTVPQVLKGQLPGRGFLLTDADYKPLEPRQAVLASQFLALVNIPTSSNYHNNIKLGRAVGDAGIGTPASEFLRKFGYIPKLTKKKVLTRDMAESHLAEFSPDCLPVYCARNDARQHALWKTLDRVRDGKPPGDGFLLTDADYRPLEPLTYVRAARLLSMGGFDDAGGWQTKVRLGKGGDAEGYDIHSFLFVLRGGPGPKSAKAQGPNQSNSTQLPGSASPGPAQAPGPKPTLASQPLTEEQIQACLAKLPPEGVPVYCDKQGCQHALWTTAALVLAGKPPGDGFLLTDEDYKPLEPEQRVTSAKLVTLGGFQPYGNWQTKAKLGRACAGVEQGGTTQSLLQALGYKPPPNVSKKRAAKGSDTVMEKKTKGARSRTQAEQAQAGAGAGALVSHEVQATGPAYEAASDEALCQAAPLPPLQADYQGTGQAVLKNEAEVIAAMTGLLRVLGQSNARVQLLQLFRTTYASSSVGYQALSLHYTSLQSAMQSGSSRAVLDVFRDEFGLDV